MSKAIQKHRYTTKAVFAIAAVVGEADAAVA